MKNLIAKLKGMKFKELILEHGEKFALGVIGLFVLFCLGATSWSGYARQPEELAEASRNAESQLLKNQWPLEQQKEYQVVDLAEQATEQLVASVPVERFTYDKPMSFKLYPREQPIGEPSFLPVEDLQAKSGTFVLALANRSTGDEPAVRPADNPDGGRNQRPGAGGQGGNDSGDSDSSAKARGVRYVAIVGIVPYLRQMQKMMDAERRESLSAAADDVEYLDFKIERQRALSGKDTWSGPWEPLDIMKVMEILEEAASFDSDVVATEVTEPVFTAPLPSRIGSPWDSEIVSHKKLEEYLLNEEKKAEEHAKNLATKELFDEKGLKIEPAATRKGFATTLLDVNEMRREMAGKVNPQDLQKRIHTHLGNTNQNLGAIASPGMPGGMQGDNRGTSISGHAKLLLFRYLDFAVEPGECYRYRTQLVLRNPNFEMAPEQVQEVSVTEGETRTTPWSEPSPPVIVERDVDYFLAKVPRSQSRPKGEAMLEIFQWDPKVGTLIEGSLTMQFGQFIRGEEKVTVLDVSKPSLGDGTGTFFAKDMLVDVAGAPAVLTAEHDDLHLSGREWKRLLDDGRLDLAVTVNPYGELVDQDALGAQTLIARERDRVDEERKPYLKLAGNEKKGPGNALDELVANSRRGGRDKDKDKDKKNTRLENPLRAGGR